MTFKGCTSIMTAEGLRECPGRRSSPSSSSSSFSPSTPRHLRPLPTNDKRHPQPTNDNHNKGYPTPKPKSNQLHNTGTMCEQYFARYRCPSCRRERTIARTGVLPCPGVRRRERCLYGRVDKRYGPVVSLLCSECRRKENQQRRENQRNRGNVRLAWGQSSG